MMSSEVYLELLKIYGSAFFAKLVYPVLYTSLILNLDEVLKLVCVYQGVKNVSFSENFLYHDARTR